MCDLKEHGGARCNSDNKNTRRFRDKANKTRAAYRNANPIQPAEITIDSAALTIQQTHKLAEETRTKIHSPDHNPTQDEQHLNSILIIGESLLVEAEKTANLGTNPEETYNQDIAAGMPEGEAAEKRKLAQRANREKLKQAYIKALEKVRPLGGQTQTHDADEEAQTILNRTVNQHYPTEWIEHSNNGTPFELRTSLNPEYVRESTTEEDPTAVTRTHKPAFYNFPDRDTAQAFADQHYPEGVIIETNHGDRTSYKLKVQYETGKLYDPKTDGPLMGGRPIGKQWAKEITPLALNTEQVRNSKSFEQTLKILSEPKWVKKEPTHYKNVLNIISHDDPTLQNVDDKVSAVDSFAYHEFGHRMEETIPNNALPRMEEAFLRARTNKTVTTFRTQMQTDAVEKHLYHDAGLTTTYAGRDYLNGNYEVFTVGVESLFGKNYGSLSGQHPFYTKEDRSHKAFILGALATL